MHSPPSSGTLVVFARLRSAMNEESKHTTPRDEVDKVIEEVEQAPGPFQDLMKAGIYLAAGDNDKAEYYFRRVPKDFPRYPLAVSGLFGILWERGTEAARAEAIALMNDFIETADRDDPNVKPVLYNFLRIKVGLLSAGIINEPLDDD